LGKEGKGSTAEIARLFRSPVVLVVNSSRMTRSIAAMVSGYQSFEPETKIAGVILNNVSGARHERKLRDALESHCGIPVVGSVPRDEELLIKERHLGLIPFPEGEASDSIITTIADRLEGCFDLDKILSIAQSAEEGLTAEVEVAQKEQVVKIGVLYDRVFNFYYQENLEALLQAGAELVFIDSLKDRDLPAIDGLYLGGGFPEFFLKELEANSSLRDSIREAIEDYLPVYAECAGLMYLSRGITFQGRRFEMVGVIPAEVELLSKPQGHGYMMVEVVGKNPFFPLGLSFWAHEFHHSRLKLEGEVEFAYRVERGQGIDGRVDGIIYKNVLASYAHLNAVGVPEWAEAFVSLALRRRKLLLSASGG